MRSLLLAILLLPGCAYVQTLTADDTADPRFHVAYIPTQTYTLQSPARLVGDVSTPGVPPRHLELISPRMDAYYRDHPQYATHLNGRPTIATIPAGATVRIDTLRHNWTLAIPPVPGDSQILQAYGTLATPVATWTDVQIPHDPDAPWHFVPTTGVMAFRPDTDFLKPE